MRVIKGKTVRPIDRADLLAWSVRYEEIVVDLGAGDGRFVRHLAAGAAGIGAIGVDLCAAGMRNSSRTAGENALFVIGDALALPDELSGVATRVTINFPWGSLLRGLLDGDPGLVAGLGAVGRERTDLRILLNAGAFAQTGWSPAAGIDRVTTVLCRAGFAVGSVSTVGPADLRRLPTTWAKRLAFGRDPRAFRIEATLARSGSAAGVDGRVGRLCHQPAGDRADGRLVAAGQQRE